MIKVSIITPVYNSQNYLEQCLESVINQTMPDFEMICVNDGSTDNSLKILENYAEKDNRIIIINKENEGQGAARNLAISGAKGEYVLCLDSDDWLEINALELAYNKIKQDDSDILFYNCYQFHEKLQSKNILHYVSAYSKFNNMPFTPKQAGEILFKTNGLPFKIYKTEFLKKNNVVYSNHKFSEDVCFYIKSMIKADKISCLSVPIYNYRVRKTSSTYDFKEYFSSVPEVFDICFDIIKEESNSKIIKSFIENRKKSLFYFYFLTPLFSKHKYYKMMREIISKHFLEYGLDKEMEFVLKNNFIVYKIYKSMRKTKANSGAYRI